MFLFYQAYIKYFLPIECFCNIDGYFECKFSYSFSDMVYCGHIIENILHPKKDRVIITEKEGFCLLNCRGERRNNELAYCQFAQLSRAKVIK